MKPRIAKVPYLNSVAFFQDEAWEGRFETSESVPRSSAQRLEAGELDAALIPLAEFLRGRERYERIGHFGIATRGRSHSALLFSKAPVRQLENAAIALTNESASSVRLLRLILEQRYHLEGVSYRRGPADADCEASLLIGDAALAEQTSGKAYPFVMDIGTEWWLWRHVPCVFAVWAMRRDTDAAARKAIEASVARSLALYTANQKAVVEANAGRCGLSAEQVESYLNAYVFRLGPEEEEGIRAIDALFQRHGLLEWEPEEPARTV